MLIMFTFCDILYLEETNGHKCWQETVNSYFGVTNQKKCSVTFWGAKAPLINNIGMFTSCTIDFNCIQTTRKNRNK